MDFKKLAQGLTDDTNGVFNDIKNVAKNTLNSDKLKESIENVANKTKEGGNVFVNISEEVKQNVGESFDDITKATTSAYNTVTNTISGGVNNAKNYSPDKIFSSMVKKVWKEDDKVLGCITITRGQKITYSLSFVLASVLFLGMDLSLLFITHEFEYVKYSIFFGIWTLLYLIGIHILDSAVPKQFFEKKTKTVRITSIIIYSITMIGGIVVANVFPKLTYSIIAFVVHFISFAWLTTTHMPTYKGLNLSYFTEKSPLLFSSF